MNDVQQDPQPSAERQAFNSRKKALIDKGVSQRAVARASQPPVTDALVHQVLRGRRKSPRVMAALVQLLGADIVSTLWPA